MVVLPPCFDNQSSDSKENMFCSCSPHMWPLILLVVHCFRVFSTNSLHYGTFYVAVCAKLHADICQGHKLRRIITINYLSRTKLQHYNNSVDTVVTPMQRQYETKVMFSSKSTFALSVHSPLLTEHAF